MTALFLSGNVSRQDELEDLDAEIQLALLAGDYSRARAALERYPYFAKERLGRTDPSTYKLYYGERDWGRRVKHYKVLLAALPIFDRNPRKALHQLEAIAPGECVPAEREWYRASALANLGYLETARYVLKLSLQGLTSKEDAYFYKWMQLMGDPIWFSLDEDEIEVIVESGSPLVSAAIKVWRGRGLLQEGRPTDAARYAQEAKDAAYRIATIEPISGGSDLYKRAYHLYLHPSQMIRFEASLLEAQCWLAEGNFGKAAEACKMAELASWDTGLSYTAVVWAYSVRALAEARAGGSQIALRYCQAVEKYLDRVNDVKIKSLVCSYLGQAYWYLQQKEKGIRWLKKALEIAEKREIWRMPLSLRAEYYATWQDIYRTLVQMLVLKGKIDEAFVISQRGRNRALFDVLSRGYSITSSGERYKQLATQANDLRRRLAFENVSEKDAALIRRQLTTLEREMREELALHSRKQAPAFYQHKNIRHFQKYLRPNQLALVYQLLPNGGIAWAIGRNFVKYVYLPPEKEISNKCRELHASIGDPSKITTDSAWCKSASWLYDHLVRPFPGIGKAEWHLLVVPDGDVAGVPFEAFFDKDTSKYLIDTAEITYVPSLAVLEQLLLRERKGSDRLLLASVSGMPTADSHRIKEELRGFELGYLPFVDFEAKEIESIYGIDKTLWLRGREASEGRIKSRDLSQYGILHFACHAVMPSDVQWLSEPALILGTGETRTIEDGLLMSREVEQLKLESDLVVLSACDTAGGKFVKGTGYIGLATSFMAAGAKRILVSQWKVNDWSTALLMKKFYENMREGDSPQTALRQAKLWLKKREFSMEELRGFKVRRGKSSEDFIFRNSFDHPFFWAPFVLIGLPGK